MTRLRAPHLLGTFLAAAAVLAAGAGGASSTSSQELGYLATRTIFVVDAKGGNRTGLVEGVALNSWAWSPDGQSIAYTKGRASIYDGEIDVVKADGTDAHAVSGDTTGACCPTWSPDGSRIAFAATFAGGEAIYVAPADGSGPAVRITSPPPRLSNDYDPDWSPDGSTIVFERYGDSSIWNRAMTVHPDGSGVHQVAVLRAGSWCICPDWSPDGSKLAYEAGSTRPFRLTPELWVMNADGSGRVQLTHNAVVDENPDWSPDGKKLAFYSGRNGNQEIWVVDADGGRPRRVTHDPANARFPRWRPGG